MKKQLLKWGMAAIAAVLFFSNAVTAATVSWVGGSGDWDTVTNWSTGQLPGPEDDVVIGSGPSITVTHSSGADTVNSITTQQPFQLSGGALIVASNAVMGSSLIVSAGAAIIAQTLDCGGAWFNAGTIMESNGSLTLSPGTNTGTILLSGGSMTVADRNYSGVQNTGGTIVVTASSIFQGVGTDGSIEGGAITISNGASLIVEGTVLFGEITITGTLDVGNAYDGNPLVYMEGMTLNGTMLLGNPTNSSTGTLSFVGSQTLGGNGTVIFGNNSENQFAFQYAEGDTLTIGPGITVRGQAGQLGTGQPGSIINQGLISCDLTGGIYVDSQSFVNQGTAQATNGGEFAMGDSAQTFWVNNGTISETGGSLYLGEYGTNNGTVLLSGGSATVGLEVANYDGTIAVLSSATLLGSGIEGSIGGGNITTSNGATMIVGGQRALVLAGVTVNGTLDVGYSANANPWFVVEGMTLNGTMLIGNPTNGNVGTVNFDYGTTSSGGLNGNGTVVFGNNPGNLLGVPNGTLVIGPGITIRGQYGQIGTGGNGSIINQGLISCDLTGGIYVDSQSFVNQGTAQATNGGEFAMGDSAQTFWVNNGTISETGGSLYLGEYGTNNGTVLLSGGSATVGLEVANYDGTIAVLSSATLLGSGIEGSIGGGNITTSNGATMIVGGQRALVLAGVTVNGTLDVGYSANANPWFVVEGMTLNGTMLIGNPTNGNVGTVNFDYGTTSSGGLNGNGTVVFGNNPGNLLGVPNGTLVIGPGITVRGQAGQIGSAGGGAINDNGAINAIAGSVIMCAGPLAFEGEAAFSSQVGATIEVGGDLKGDTRNADQYTPQGTTELLSGSHLLEAMSQDRGNVARGFVNNFAYGTLALDSGAQVSVIDNFTNSAGPLPECVYVNSLIMAVGTTLNLNGLHLYARLVQTAFNSVVTNGTVSRVPIGGGAITINTSIGGTLSALDSWTFLGRAGEHVTVTVDTGSASVVPPTLNYAFVQLFDPSMNLLAQASNTVPQQIVALVNEALPVDGTYTVLVQAPANQPTATGNYLVTAWDITSNPQSLVFDQQELGQITTPYSGNQWNFSGVSGEQIQFNLINESAPGIAFTLDGPDGWIGFSNLISSSGLITLPFSGAYSLNAFGTGGAYGINYAFVMVQSAETNLIEGGSFTGTFVANGQPQMLAVTVTNSGPLLITLNNPGVGNVTELYAQLGAPPTRGTFGWESINPSSPNQQILIANAIPGTYYILVYGNLITTPGTFTVQAVGADVFVTALAPATGQSSAEVTLTLTGGGFLSAATVALVTTNGTSYPASTVSVDSFTQITATFASNTLPAGVYSLAVNASSVSATLTNSFVVLSGGTPNFTSSLIVPAFVSQGTPAAAYAIYGNSGNARMPAPLLVLMAMQNGVQGGILGLDPSLLLQAVWTSAQQPVGFGNSCQFLASGQTPGVLQPGEALSVPVYWATFNGPFYGHAPVDWNLGVLKAGDPTRINWSSLESSMQPAGMPPDAWNAIFTALTNEVGATWGDYVTTLDNNSSYLGRLGLNITDVSKLLPFEILQADGLCPIQTLASSVDASVVAPGLPLTFSRSFGERISQRYALGPLGRGWSHNWQYSLQQGSDGTVTITGPGGSQRIFQPDKRGGYFNQAGDYGALAPDGSGGYTLTEKTGLLSDYATNGTLNYVQDLNANRITLGYTGGLLTSLTHSSGQNIQIGYNGASLIQTVTDQFGHQTILTYDAANQHLMGAQYFDGRTATYTYNTTGSATQLHALTGSATSCCNWRYFTYDSSGRLSGTYLSDNAEAVTLSYGGGGQVNVIDALTNTTQFFYDHRGLLAKTEDALGNFVQRSFDNNYDLVAVTDPAGKSYNYGYDSFGNLVQSRDPLGDTSQFTYTTAFNRLASVTDANGNTTQYGYDAYGNLQTTTYANNSVESWTYDSFGNPQSWTNRRGHQTVYTNNVNGQITAKQFADGSLTTYIYDFQGNLTNAATFDTNLAPLELSTMIYDGSNRLAQITYPGGKYLNFTYDSNGRRTSSTDQLGHSLYYYYDDAGRLTSMTNELNALVVFYQYDPAGRIATKTLGNGMCTTYHYDPAGQVLGLTNALADGTLLSYFNYVYDSRGRRTSMASIDGQWTYTYDDIGQLTHAVFAAATTNIPNQDLLYVYDAVGNRVQAVENGVTNNYTANNLNQYVSVGATKYTFDADGNLTQEDSPNGTTTYQYNDENRLISLTSPHGNWQYTYDAFKDRTVTAVNGTPTRYVIDPVGLGNVVGEYDAAGNLLAHFDHGSAQSGLLSRTDGTGNEVFYTFDAIGNVQQMVNAAGVVANNYAYSPFGGSLTSIEIIPNPFQFAGQFGVLEDVNGLNFMRARYYQAQVGRFASVDPIRFRRTSGLYTYALNNPNSHTDPSGLDAWQNQCAAQCQSDPEGCQRCAVDKNADACKKCNECMERCAKGPTCSDVPWWWRFLNWLAGL